MTTFESLGVPKVHPATRPVEPEDPMNLHGFEVPGDPEFMLKILVEEYARLGYSLEPLMALCRDPFYVGLHGLWRLFGEEGLRRRIATILSSCFVIRTRTSEAASEPEQLVSLTLSTGKEGSPSHA